MTRCEIFDDVARVMREDASFCKDLKGGDAKKYRALVREDMSDKEFLFLVNRYLATFKLVAHLGFEKRSGNNFVPCLFRQYKGELYVVTAPKESAIKSGHKVVAADGLTIDELTKKYPEFFFEECEDRRGIIWGKFLSFFDELTLQSPTEQYKVKLPLEGELPLEGYKFSKLRDDVCYLLFDDFAQEKPIVNLIDEHSDEIIKSRYLVIDVRNNGGGLDTAFLPLLKFCLKEKDDLCGAAILPEEKNEFNYTVNNATERIKLLEYYRKVAAKENLPLFDREIALNKALSGKGFAREENGEECTYPLQGTKFPERVFVVTDCNCGSSGDSFVQVVSPLDKVTVVGRPTMGILDYSNLAFKEYGDFCLLYPTSRRIAIDKGGAMGGKGIPVDIFVPWTPEFLQKDKDLEKVFDLINGI